LLWGINIFFSFHATCVGIIKIGRWEDIIELQVQYLKYMMEFSVEYLAWTYVWQGQVSIIPHCQLEDFISGKKLIEVSPT